MKKLLIFCTGVLLTFLLAKLLPQGPGDLPSSQISIHHYLGRRLTPDRKHAIDEAVICTDDRWSWGFPHALRANGLSAVLFPLRISVNHFPVMIKGGFRYPSHWVLESEIDSAKSNLAANPLRLGFPQPFASFSVNGNEWDPIDGCPVAGTGWFSESPRHWYGVDLGESQVLLSAVLEFLETDQVHLPESFYLEHEVNGIWVNIPEQLFFPGKPAAGPNLVRFPRIRIQKIRVVLHSPGQVGLVNFQLQGEGTQLPLVTEEKFITADNVLCSGFTIQNQSWQSPLTIDISGLTPWAEFADGDCLCGQLPEGNIVLALAGLTPPDLSHEIKFRLQLQPREKKQFRFVIAFDADLKSAREKAQKWVTRHLPVSQQIQNFDAWFQRNIPFFLSSNRDLNHAWYEAWVVLRQQLLQANAPNYTFCPPGTEIADTTIFEVNQFIQEIRWLRNPDLAWNFIKNFQKAVLAESTRPASASGAFLVSGICDLNQVHPDREYLASQLEWIQTSMQRLIETRDLNRNYLLEIDEGSTIAGFLPEPDLLVRQIEPVGLNAEFFQACQALETGYRFCGLNLNHEILSPKIKHAFTEKNWSPVHHFFFPADAATGAPVFDFKPSALTPFRYDLADSMHLSIWEHLLPRIRQSISQENKNLPAVDALLHTWQRFSNGPVTSEDLEIIFHKYFGPDRTDRQNEVVPAFPGRFLAIRPMINLITTGIVGITPEAETDRLVLHPALPGRNLSFFVLENINYHGRQLTIIWDRPDETDYFQDHRSGFDIYLDGKRIQSSPRLERIGVAL